MRIMRDDSFKAWIAKNPHLNNTHSWKIFKRKKIYRLFKKLNVY